jgi:hypothetical protein
VAGAWVAVAPAATATSHLSPTLVGLFGLNHPELVTVGLSIEMSARALNDVARRVMDGQNLIPGALLSFEDWPHSRCPRCCPTRARSSGQPTVTSSRLGRPSLRCSSATTTRPAASPGSGVTRHPTGSRAPDVVSVTSRAVTVRPARQGRGQDASARDPPLAGRGQRPGTRRLPSTVTRWTPSSVTRDAQAATAASRQRTSSGVMLSP